MKKSPNYVLFLRRPYVAIHVHWKLCGAPSITAHMQHLSPQRKQKERQNRSGLSSKVIDQVSSRDPSHCSCLLLPSLQSQLQTGMLRKGKFCSKFSLLRKEQSSSTLENVSALSRVPCIPAWSYIGKLTCLLSVPFQCLLHSLKTTSSLENDGWHLRWSFKGLRFLQRICFVFYLVLIGCA